MQQKRLFTSGIDSDTANEFVEQGRDRFRLNVRVLSSDTGQVGAVETVNGNTLVTFTLPVGVNTVIGSTEYQIDKKNYYFVHNSNSQHSILEFDQVTEAISVVFRSSILNFQLTALITGINVIRIDVGKTLLYWTDGWVNPLNPDDYNEPKKINIEKGKAYMLGDFVNGYKFPFDADILYRIKTPPLCAPDYTWSGMNNTAGEFRASNSTWITNIATGSPIVRLTFDNPYFNPNLDFNPADSIWTVTATGDFSISGQMNLLLVAPPTSGGISYNFSLRNVDTGAILYNRGNVSSFSQVFSLVAGDRVALYTSIIGASGGVVDVQGVSFGALRNATTTSDVNHLFKKLFTFKVQFEYDDYERSAWSPISNYVLPETLGSSPTGEDIIFQDNKITIQVPTGGSIVTKIRISAKEVSETDFSLIAILDKSDLGILDNVFYDYDFTNTVNATPLEVNESIKLFDNVPLYSGTQELIKGIRIADGNITENFDPVAIDMRLGIDYVEVTTNFNSFYPAVQYPKTGCLSEWAIVYYDHANRSGLANVVKGQSTVILQDGRYGTSLYVPFLTEDTYNPAFPNGRMDYVPQINTEIYNEPPAWATHYQILRSKNQTMGRWIQFTAQDVDYVDIDDNAASRASAVSIIVNLGNITGRYLSENRNSTLVYDWIKGDRIRFIAAPSGSGTSYSAITNFLPFNDTEISSWDPLTQNISVPINGNAILRDADIRNGVLFEIYDPISPVIEGGELMYEIGECYDILTLPNGDRVHQGLQGDQQYWSFYNDSYQAGYVGFVGLGASGYVVGDKVKATSSVLNANNTYGEVTNIIPSGASEIVVTSILWAANSVTNAGTLTRAATTNIRGGDCFRRYCNMPWIDGVTPYRLYSYTETMSANNTYTSNAYFFGRPNRIDDEVKRITRPSTITYSDKLIPETFINGLSSTSDNNFETYELPYGAITNLDSDDQKLIMYQELKVAGIPVEQGVVSTTQGVNVVGVADQVLSPTAIYYAADYGLGRHPESFAKYANIRYGIDVKRGVVWRLSTDGLTPISEYFQHTFFTELCRKIMLSSDKVNVYGVYDIRFGEYVVAISEFTYNGVTEPAHTLAFNEKSNVWSTHYSYAPENTVGNGVNIITFKSGGLWKHNTNAIQNNFYGVQYASEVHSICNENPSNVKILEAIAEESNDAWEVYEITTPNGQLSNLLASDFEEKENMQYANVLFDENTPNVTNPLIEGDVIRDTTFLTKLRYSPTIYNKLFAVNYQYIISNRHNR